MIRQEWAGGGGTLIEADGRGDRTGSFQKGNQEREKCLKCKYIKITNNTKKKDYRKKPMVF